MENVNKGICAYISTNISDKLYNFLYIYIRNILEIYIEL